MKPVLSREQITQVYSGRPGCMCGCRGNYSSNKGVITKALKLYAAVPALDEAIQSNGDTTGDDEEWVTWETATRTYTIYYKKGA